MKPAVESGQPNIKTRREPTSPLTIAGGAPMIGFLGTVIGMIKLPRHVYIETILM